MTGNVAVERKHSGIGIASFILGTIVGVLMFVVFAVAGVMEASTPGGIDENSTGAILLGLALIAFVCLDMLALGLGIGGLLQKDRKRLFAILGVVFSGATLLLTALVMLIGLMA